MFRVLGLMVGMFVTRVVAIRILKQELFIHFYTEMHINLSYAATAAILFGVEWLAKELRAE